MSGAFGNLPKGGGVTTLGGQDDSRPIVSADQARRVTPIPQNAATRRVRGDQNRLQYEALVEQGRVKEARALLEAKPQPNQPRPRQDSARRLVDSGQARGSDGRALAPGSAVPRVVEGPLPTRAPGQAAGGAGVRFRSVDGSEFRTRISVAPKKDAAAMFNAGVENSLNVLLLAFRELALGGDPFAVFDAFSVELTDEDGQAIFPVPHEARGRHLVDWRDETSAAEAAFEAGLRGPTFGRAPAPAFVEREAAQSDLKDAVTGLDEVDWSQIPGGEDSTAAFDRLVGVEAFVDDPGDVEDVALRAIEGMDAETFEAFLRRLSPEKLGELGFQNREG